MSMAGFYCHVIKNKNQNCSNCWCPSDWATTWRPETNRDICRWVLLLKRKFISQGTHKHYSNTFSDTMTVERTNSPNINHFSDSSLGRHAAPGKSLEIQAYCITKRSAFWSENFSKYYILGALILSESKHSEGSIYNSLVLNFDDVMWKPIDEATIETPNIKRSW